MTTIQDADLSQHSDRLPGAVVFITGGGSGIGKSSSLKFASHGAKVVVADLNLAGAEETVTEIQKAGGSAIAVKCDVTVWEDQVAAFEAAITEYGKVDVIVANAGVAEIGQFLGVPLGEDGKPVKPNLTTLDVNLTGVVYTINLAQHYLFKGGLPSPGSIKAIVTLSSMAAWQATPGGPLYSSSKLGVLGLVRSVGQIFASKGVRISVVHPFFADTPIMNARTHQLLAGIPLTPVDRISSAVVYGATDPDLSTYATALIIPDDGPVTRWENERLKEGVYKEIDARLNKVYGFKV